MVVSLYEFKVHKRIFTHFYHDGMRDLLGEDLVKTFPPGNSFIPENIFFATFSRIDSSLVSVWSFDRKKRFMGWCFKQKALPSKGNVALSLVEAPAVRQRGKTSRRCL